MAMATPVESVARNFLTLGVYDLVLFAIFSALFYAVLRKTKVLGDSAVLNGTVSLGMAFIIFGFPIISGTGSLLYNITVFFTQATIFALVFFIGFLIASFFYPNMPDMLSKTFAHRTTLWIVLALVFVLFITSGLVSVIWKAARGTPATGTSMPSSSYTIPDNILLFIAGISIFMVFIIIASSMVRSD